MLRNFASFLDAVKSYMLNKIKSLAQDTAIYGAFRMLTKLLSFLLTPLYANYLLGHDFAFINFIFPVIAIINVVYTLGMETAFFRFYNLENKEEGKLAFSNAYLSVTVISLSITIVIQLFAGGIADWVCNYLYDPKSDVNITYEKMLMLVRLAAFIPMIDAFTWIPYDYLRMVRKAKKFSLVQLTQTIVTFCLMYLSLAHLGYGVLGVLGSNVIGSALGVFLLRKEVFNHLVFKIDRVLIRSMYIFGIPVMLSNMPAMILQVLDKVIMPDFLTTYEFNTYSTNYKLGIPMMIIVTMFDYAWKPFFLSHYKDDDSNQMFGRVFTYFTLFSAFAFLTFTFFMPYLVQIPLPGGRELIPQKYWGGMGIIPIILGGYYFNGAITNFAAAFHITKKTKFITITMWLAAAFNIGLNVLLMPIIGIWGAAWATFAAYFMGAVTAYFLSKRIYTIRYEWGRIGIMTLILLGIYFSTIEVTSGMGALSMFLIRLGALVLFGLLLYVFKFFTPAEIKQITKMLRRKKIK